MSPLVLCQEVFVPELLVTVATLEQLGNWPLLELGLLTRDLGGNSIALVVARYHHWRFSEVLG